MQSNTCVGGETQHFVVSRGIEWWLDRICERKILPLGLEITDGVIDGEGKTVVLTVGGKIIKLTPLSPDSNTQHTHTDFHFLVCILQQVL